MDAVRPQLAALHTAIILEESFPCWVDSLPDELISAILLCATPKTLAASLTDEYNITLRHRLQFPISIQLVCRRWRTIALTTPGLWTTLHINIPQTSNFLLHLGRSGVLPLEVHLQSPIPEPSSPCVLPGELSEANGTSLAKQAHRFKSIVVHGETTGDTQTIVKSLPANLPNLLELTLCAALYNGSDDEGLPLLVPRLRSLCLINYSPEWAELPVSSHLHELCVADHHVTSVHFGSFFTALGACSNLRVLEVENQLLTDGNDPEVWHLQPFTLDHLEELSLKQFYQRELKCIFNLVRTPQLKRLVVEGLRDYESHDVGEPLELRFPRLETLELRKVDLALDIAKGLTTVKHLAFLRDLDLDAPEEMDNAFDMLRTYWQSRQSPLPLETLQTSGVELSTIIALLDDDRRNTVPHLRKVIIDVRDAFLGRGNPERTFRLQIEQRKLLSTLVELEVSGDPMENPDGSRSESPVFETWKERQSWVAEQIR